MPSAEHCAGFRTSKPAFISSGIKGSTLPQV